MKYFGFYLKPCRYLLKDWDSLIGKAEKRIKNWSFRWLSKGGKLILVKSVLEDLPVYWMHFWIPVGVIEKVRKICFKFLWSGNSEFSSGFPWTSWKVLANPKFLGGWGLKVPALFAKELAAKVSRILFMDRYYGLILLYINILGLYIYWIGSEPMKKRKEVYLYAGNLCYDPLILLGISLFGR